MTTRRGVDGTRAAAPEIGAAPHHPSSDTTAAPPLHRTATAAPLVTLSSHHDHHPRGRASLTSAP